MTPAPAPGFPRSSVTFKPLTLGWCLIALLTAQAILAGTIAGTVTDAQSGAKLPSMVVAAYNSSGALQATATTDSSGRYFLTSLPSGEFRVLAYDQNGIYATTFAGNAESYETSPTVSPDRSGYDFALIKGGTASGSVARSDGGSVVGITVAAYNLSGTRRAFVERVSGAWTLVLPPGTYKFVAFDDAGVFAPSFYSEQRSFSAATPVVIESQRPRSNIDLRQRLAAHLSGVVSEALTHRPLSGFVVSAFSPEGVLLATAVSSTTGSFQMSVPDGTVRLVVADPTHTYATGYFGGANSFAQTSGLTLTGGEARADLVLEVERAGFLSGSVSSRGSAVCCVTVAAYNADGSQRTTARTDSNGAYQLVVPPGDFRIGAFDEALVYAPKFYVDSTTFRGANAISVVRAQNAGPANLTLDRAARVTGHISDSLTSSALGSIMVSAYDSAGFLAGTAVTDATGVYSLGLAAGTFRLVAFDSALRYATAYPQRASTFEGSPAYNLNADTTTSVDFALAPGTRVTGSVVDPSRTGLSGVDVAALSLDGNRVSTTTSQAGAFTLVLPPGNYKFVANDPSGRYSTMYFNSSWTLANAMVVSVSTSGSSPATLTFFLQARQMRHRSVGR